MSDATDTATPVAVDEQQANGQAGVSRDVTAAAAARAQAEAVSAQPNQTLYLYNLNDKIKLPNLKKSLYELFSQFGAVLDIVASKGLRLRGQAWVVFRDLDAAAVAKRKLQDHILFDKAIQIEFAKAKSDVVAKEDGTFVRRPKRVLAKGAVPNREPDAEKRAAKKRALAEKNQGGALAKLNDPEHDLTPPNKLLFVENLPEECTEVMLSMLFRQYDGFGEVRIVPGKVPPIAFVEFETPEQSGAAKTGLQGFKITADTPMRITFARQ